MIIFIIVMYMYMFFFLMQNPFQIPYVHCLTDDVLSVCIHHCDGQSSYNNMLVDSENIICTVF